jgi:hypothetical protein
VVVNIVTLCGDNWLYEEASLKKIRVVLAELSEKTMMSMFTQHENQSLSVKKGYFRSKLKRDMTLCGDNWLYEEASLKKSGSSLPNSARKQ